MFDIPCIAIIPAYEPDILMLDLLTELSFTSIQPIVINDGSAPAYDTVFTAAEKHAVVLSHPENRGKGCALKTGLTWLKDNMTGPYLVVTLDADGQHTVPDAMRVCRSAEQNPDSLVLGSRELKKEIPLRSRIGNSITRLVYRTATGLRVHDTQTGLRAFHSRHVPKMLEIRGDRYEYEMNVLMTYAREKIPIREETIATIYLDQNSRSHFNTVRDSVRIYREILKFSASSLCRFLREILKFSGTSIISFFIDYGFYSLFTLLTAGLGTASIPVSNISARVISAGVNFTLNRKFVFRSRKNLLRSALEYFLLAAVILAGNTLVLYLLSDMLGMNRYIAKLITEIFFFLVSWIVQRLFVFRSRNGSRSESSRNISMIRVKGVGNHEN